MAVPKPWSYSALEDFVNCPRSFYEKRIAKSVQETESEQMLWGTRVHKHFEDRQALRTPLPEELSEHERFMGELDRKAGTLYTERKVALNRQLQPTGFFDKDVWWRGVIDWTKVSRAETAEIFDYKTGKMHSKFQQLKLFALYTFAEFPHVHHVDVKYYWTKLGTRTGEVYHRRQIPELWAEFVPDLKQYAQAFREDEWQPRQSGLCHGWCPVTTCEFWQSKKRK